MNSWYDLAQSRTNVELTHDGQSVTMYIADETITRISGRALRFIRKDMVNRLVALWTRTYGKQVVAIEPEEGAMWAFRVEGEVIEGEVVEGCLEGQQQKKALPASPTTGTTTPRPTLVGD